MFNVLLNKRAPAFWGIDIGTHSVKAVLLSARQNRFCLEAFTVRSLPSGVIQDRQIRDRAALTRALADIRKHHSGGIKNTAIAVSGSSVITKIIKVDRCLTDTELESLIAVDADALIPYPLSEVNIDFERLDPDDADLSTVPVLLTAARAEIVQSRLGAMTQSGFSTRVVDVESYALSRGATLCFHQLPADAKDKVVALVDIGATMLLLSIVESGKTRYTRDQFLGAEGYSNKSMALYQQAAGTALTGTATAVSNELVSDELGFFQAGLLQQIRRSIQQYLTTSGKDRIDYLMLSGGSALSNGLDQYLANALGVYTVIANPFHTMDVATGVVRVQLARSAPQLLIATGLAMRGFAPWHI